MRSVRHKDRIGYVLLTIGVVVGLFAGWENDNAIKEVNSRQTTFIIEQCKRDADRNEIVIDSLEGAQRRAAVTFKDDQALARVEVDRIQEQINRFKNSPPCRLP